ncbi:hypothetical protein P775_22800 [Puniceibacterium antarcticum]|uniref:Carboxymuconolactone decarboxylase n=1 Tax=Puniceibacterium antarcticum TaxID=1206336 RepID=A0A2G8R8I2_9RHOB|nr:carboxymuconolactone decarboxylase family protein [Puniceibacterium antarcticum]PIL17860.1 hypothetical protein P775_22800 [Puniceibacterium antarcticum]
MKKLPHALAFATLGALPAEAQTEATDRFASDAVYTVAPQLGRLTDDVLYGSVWTDTRTLALRDRSLITMAALLAAGQSGQIAGPVVAALDSGVTPEELSEAVTHLAFYSGWPVALSSIAVITDIFTQRGITVQIDADTNLLPYDEDAESARLAAVDANARPVSPGLADATDNVVFAEIWRRPGLAPRDRSMMTVAALIAMGQSEQVPFHLNRAMDNGLSFEEAQEIPHQVAYYTGWPKSFSALSPMRSVFEDRGEIEAAASEDDAEVTTLSVVRSGSDPAQGPGERFTGNVTVSTTFSAPGDARLSGGHVQFEAGAHTAWHSHPLGQTLYITSGCALVQIDGQDPITAATGDIVQIPADARHWHGATAEGEMTHLAILEQLDSKGTTWMEKLDAQTYAAAAAACD